MSDWNADGGRDSSEQRGPKRAAFCVVAYMGTLRAVPDVHRHVGLMGNCRRGKGEEDAPALIIFCAVEMLIYKSW